MAFKIVGTFDVDTGNSLQATDAVSKGMQTAANSTVSLKKELREMQQQLAKLDPNSKAFQELSIRAGEVKDRINDASEAVRANAGNAFEGLSNNAGLLGDRLMNLDFEGVASAAQGLGANIGRIDFKTLTAGIQQAGNSFAALGRALLTNPIFLLGASLALIISYWSDIKAAAVSVSAEEQKSLNLKIAKAEASKKELDSFRLQENALRLQGLSEKEILKLRIEKIKTQISDAKASLESQRLIRDAEAATEKKFYDATSAFFTWINAPLVLLLNAVDGVLYGLKAVGLVAEDTYASIGDLSDKAIQWQTSLFFDPDAAIAENAKYYEEQDKAIAELQSQADGYELSLREMDKKTTDSKIKENKTRTENQKTATEDIAALEEEQLLSKMSATNRELYLADKKYKELIIKANGNKEEIAKLEALWEAEITAIQTKSFEERQAQELKLLDERIKANKEANDAIRKQMDADEKLRIDQMQDGIDKELEMRAVKFDEEIAQAGDNAELQKAITDRYIADVTLIEDKYRLDKQKKDEQARQARIKNIQDELDLAGQGLNALSSLGDAYFANRKNKLAGDEKATKALAEKQFKFNKKMQLAGAIVDAGKAITASLAASPVAIGAVPNPAGIASLAFASATSAANIAKILATKFDSGNASSAAPGTPSIAGGGGEGGAPQFNPLASAFINNRPTQMMGAQQSYVLAGDVANATEARNKVIELARL
mgnify:CR=1 FL=1